MKKLFHILTLLLVAGALHAQAANELRIDDFSIQAGDTITVPVLLDNPLALPRVGSSWVSVHQVRTNS